MSSRKKKNILLTLVPLVLVAGGIFMLIRTEFNPGQGAARKVSIEEVREVNLALGPTIIEAKTLKNEWFLNWDLLDVREEIKFDKVDNLQYRVLVQATGFFVPVDLTVWTADLMTSYTVTLIWDENVKAIDLSPGAVIF